MAKIALIDVVRPYFFAGVDLGPGIQSALELLHVDDYDTAWDDDGVVIWGDARIDSDNPQSPVFSPSAGGGAQSGDVGRFEWHNIVVHFRLTAARRAAGAVTVSGAGDLTTLLNSLGPTSGAAASDFPSTQFRLELMFEVVTVQIDRLIGAKLSGWVLVPDPDRPVVKLILPRILLRITQDSAASTNFDVGLGSFGAETLEDADRGVASLLAMDPPFALTKGKQFGFGIRKAVLDLSDQHTPLDLLAHFGIGDDWQGIYVPEARLFVATQDSAGVAFNVGVREMLIGIQPSFGLWGDLSFDLDFQGDALKVAIRIYDMAGKLYETEAISSANAEAAHADRYQVTVPASSGPEAENFVLFVDVNSGAAPFVMTAVAGENMPQDDLDTYPDNAFFDDTANHPEDISVTQRIRLFSQEQRVAVRITSRNPAQRRVIVLDVFPNRQFHPEPSPEPAKVPKAALDPESARIYISDSTDVDAVLTLSPADGILTVDGQVKALTGGAVRIPIAEDSSKPVEASWTTAGSETRERFTIPFEKGRPREGETTGALSIIGSVDDFVARALEDTSLTIRVDGFASREDGDAQTTYNKALSERRTKYLKGILVARGIDAARIADIGFGNNSVPQATTPITSGLVPGDRSANDVFRNPNYVPDPYRVAVASLMRPTSTTQSYSGTLSRKKRDTVPTPKRDEVTAPQGQQADWLRHIGGTVRFERDLVPIAGELRLTVDFKTAHEEGLEKFRNDVDLIGPGLEDPQEQARLPQGAPNPDDGVVEFRFTITHDPTTGEFTETLVARAAETDRDGLWSWGTIPVANSTAEPPSDGWRDVLGLYFTLAPLLAPNAPDAASDGEIVPLAIALGTPVLVTTLGVAHVLRLTHYGVELDVRHDQDEVHAALLVDVESAIWLNIKIANREIVTMRPDKPAKIRYKAVGFAFDSQPNQPTSFLPVFDSSRGYTIDLADSGSLRVLPGLLGEDIIKVLGARIARTNPLNIEVDLGFGADLGVVKVDRFGLRLPIDPLGTPSITAIGVSVNVEGALEGRGYLEIKSDGFAGQLDLSLPSIGIRLAGGLAIRSITQGERSATGVLVTLSVELPTGIPLGGTGLAVFGFLGLFAMHHARLENPAARTPALDWFANVVAGDPTDLRGWGPALDKWAFGVGVVAGTIEGGTVLNVKGMLALELPGPRVLMFVKANLLKKRPPTKGSATGAIFATVDITRQRVLIGLQFDYHIEAVLDLKVPVEAGFFFDPPAFPPEHFYLDAGTIARPATAKILQLFEGTAYFMVHGDGIPDFPLGPLQGFSLATGLRVSFTWGNTDIGLYLRVAAGFDVGVGFAPFYFAGRVFLDGKLRLFIVSIEAHGQLKFLSDGDDSRLEGRICGKVSFFFFSVKGCVGFSLGDMPGAPFPPSPIRDLMLQSRSPALVEGSGVDRGIDTVLCHGTENGSVPIVEVREGDNVIQRQVFVPIDAIPLVQFEVAPRMASGATVDGQLSSGLPPGFGQGWQKRGPNFLKYEIRSIELQLVAIAGSPVAPGTSPVTPGPRPYTWRHPPQQGGSDGMPVELALLDWKPTNVDKAMLQSPGLDGMVDDRFGDVCTKVAEAASVLWTFRHSLMGPSEAGWRLTGEAWPDAPGTTRSQPVDTAVKVYETWRTNTFLDGLMPGLAARVVGTQAACPRPPRRPFDPRVVAIDRLRMLEMAFEPSPPTTRPPRDRRLAETIIARAPRVTTNATEAARFTPALDLVAAASTQQCVAKVLQAPYEVLAESIVTAPGFDGLLANALNKLDDQRKESLRDVTCIKGGPFVTLTLLIFARIKMVAKGLVKVRAFGTGNKEIAGTTVTFAQLNTSGVSVPPKWDDTTGPWWDDVRLARAYFGSALKGAGGWGEFIVQIKLPSPALRVEIGVSPLPVAIHEFGMSPPSYFLAVIEGLSEYEVVRAEEDGAESNADLSGLVVALDDAKHALLKPNAEYRVVVHYSAELGQKPVEPEDGQDPNEIVTLRTVDSNDTGIGPAVRTFFTDAEAPRNLDPWILVEYPPSGELYHFTDDPVVVVFATNDVLELYAAYDRQLRAVARAASFRGSAGTPEEPLMQFLIAARYEPVTGMVFSPWEGTVRRLLNGLTCGDFNPASDRHGRVSLPFALDPLTEYIVDLEPLTMGGALARPPLRPEDMGHRPLHRQSFTTSKYRSREEFAKAVRLAPVIPDRVANPAPLVSLSDEVTDEAFDGALVEAAIEVRSRPEFARVSVLWTTDTIAQPFAVLLETPEPAWRTRLEPEPEYDAETGIYIEHWLLQRRTWLLVDELVRTTPELVVDGGEFIRRATGTKTVNAKTVVELRDLYLGPRQVPPPPLPPPPASLVSRIIHDASGTRTLVLLKPGARGKVVSLALARNLHPLLDAAVSDTPELCCEADLAPPPWEDGAT
jgi:hypothetical protein